MAFSIETSFLSDEEAARVYRHFPKLGQDPETYCPTCAKSGSYLWRGETHQCRCAYQLQLAKHYAAAGIFAEYQRLGWRDCEGNDQVLKLLVKYLERHQQYINRGIGLFFSGDQRGTGKTLLATMTLKEFVKLGYRCYSITFAGMINLFTAGWRSEEERRYFCEKIIDSDVLLLDDIGKELRRNNSLSEATFDDVLRTRVQNAHPTFITTNLSFDELEEGYGASIFSLLKQQSISWEFSGDDYRLKSNQRALDEVDSGFTRPIV